MGELHDRAIEELYNDLNFLINDYSEEVFWEDVYVEQDYFEGQILPYKVRDRQDRGKQVGEFDVLAVNHDEQVLMYVEVKPWSSGTSYAEDQIERAESFWEPRGWDVVGKTHVVDKWGDNWYDESRDFELVADGGEQRGTRYGCEEIDPDIDRYVSEVERELRDELG